MSNQQEMQLVPDEVVINKIYQIRGQKVMIDRDIAELYGIETKVLKQAVRRNIKRFPEDFMFEMNQDEFLNWRSHFVTSKGDKQGLRYMPFCFTESGVTMLSCVLSSERAIRMNIQIIRVFTRVRQMLADNTELRLEIEKIKNKLYNQDKNMEIVFRYLDELLENKEKTTQPRKAIGYRMGVNKD